MRCLLGDMKFLRSAKSNDGTRRPSGLDVRGREEQVITSCRDLYGTGRRWFVRAPAYYGSSAVRSVRYRTQGREREALRAPKFGGHESLVLGGYLGVEDNYPTSGLPLQRHTPRV